MRSRLWSLARSTHPRASSSLKLARRPTRSAVTRGSLNQRCTAAASPGSKSRSSILGHQPEDDPLGRTSSQRRTPIHAVDPGEVGAPAAPDHVAGAVAGDQEVPAAVAFHRVVPSTAKQEVALRASAQPVVAAIAERDHRPGIRTDEAGAAARRDHVRSAGAIDQGGSPADRHVGVVHILRGVQVHALASSEVPEHDPIRPVAPMDRHPAGRPRWERDRELDLRGAVPLVAEPGRKESSPGARAANSRSSTLAARARTRTRSVLKRVGSCAPAQPIGPKTSPTTRSSPSRTIPPLASSLWNVTVSLWWRCRSDR